ncbi:MAG: hypothetical protein HUU20_13995 [Pirellulales bacterium]|nr:hypothetical protein [Pirellulales bacterium]
MPTNDLLSSPLRTSVVALWRYKGRAAAVFIVTMAAAVAALFLVPREYESEARLLVRIGRENAALDPTASTGHTIALSSTRETEINSIVEHLRSRSLLERTFVLVEPESTSAPPLEREMAFRSFQKTVHIDSPRASTVVLVQCAAATPQRAQKTLATLLDLYLDEHMRISRNLGSHAFFVKQSASLKEQLDGARQGLRDAKNKAAVASLEGGRTALESQINSVEMRLREANASLAASRARSASLHGELDDVREALLGQLVQGSPNDGLAGMRQKLFELRARQEEILSTHTDEHPRAIAIRLELEGLEKALRAAEPDRHEIMQAILARETSEQASLAAQKEQLESQLSQLNRKLLELNENERVIAGLTTEVTQLEATYLGYVEKTEEARMDEALRADRITNVSILQPASFVPKPIRPQKASVLVMACLLGIFGAFAVALMSDQYGSPHRSSENGTDAGASTGRGVSSAKPHGASPSGKNGKRGDPERHYVKV